MAAAFPSPPITLGLAPLATTVVTDPGLLEGMRAEWDALLDRSATREPTLTSAWMLAWWSVFGGTGDRALRVLLLREGGRLVGLVPLLARTAWYPPALRFKRLELLGSGEDEADETCSDYLGAVAERGKERAV